MKSPLGAAGLLFASVAWAHSASDAYLTLSMDTPSTLHGQWDIALRDLDFLLKLDDDGDGKVSWGEVRHHRSDIERYAYAHLQFQRSGTACTLGAERLLIDDHADGAYAVLLFDVACPHPAKPLDMNYSLFFAVDPSHRGIVVMRSAGDTSTAVLSPQQSTITLIH